MIRLVKKHKRKAILAAPIAFLFTGQNVPMGSESLYVKPAEISPVVGKETSAEVRFDTKYSINAGDGTLRVDPAKIHINDVATSESTFNLWSSKPEWSTGEGAASWSGGIMNGPSKGPMRGQIVRVLFTPSKSGVAELTIDPNSTLLASDGNGTNIVKSIGSARILSRPINAASPDIDANGGIDVRDVSSMIDQLYGTGSKKSDINGDGVVDMADLSALLDIYQSYNQSL